MFKAQYILKTDFSLWNKSFLSIFKQGIYRETWFLKTYKTSICPLTGENAIFSKLIWNSISFTVHLNFDGL